VFTEIQRLRGILIFSADKINSEMHPLEQAKGLTYGSLLRLTKLQMVNMKNGNASNQCIFNSLALQPSAGYDLLVSQGFLITHNYTPQSVALVWTSDQLVAETST
jgi:hypothetical protein